MKNVNILRVNPNTDPNMTLERFKSSWACDPDRFVKADYVAVVATGSNTVVAVYAIDHDADVLYNTTRAKVNTKYVTRCSFECFVESNDAVAKQLLGMKYRPGRSPVVYEQFDEETAEFVK